MSRIKKSFHWAIIVFAIADVSMGIVSLFINDLIAQVIALIVTAVTLNLTVIYSAVCCKEEKIDIGGVVIGSADLLMTSLSIMIIAFSVQILELIASSMTLVKTIKIVIQSDKAKRLLNVAKPIAQKVLRRVALLATAYIAKKIKNKKENKGVLSMEKVKEFFVKFGQTIRANKISLLGTLANGSAWGAIGYLVDEAQVCAIDVFGVNITPLFSIIGFILLELCFYWESFGAFMARVSPKLQAKLEKRKAEEEAKALKEAEAQKEKEHAELLAQMLAEKEAERKVQEEKELAEWLAKKKAETNNVQ